ncbi:MAG: hypothetical protein JNK82_13585 [Myxococcaceae bacterium]|nr:hypothetical protein [Myxococcaceae bacterium]
MPQPEVSGRAFLGIIAHVREARGPNSIDGLMASTPEVTRAVFKSRILHGTWYPYAAYAGFLSALEAKFGHGDPAYCRHLGASSGVRDINTVFKIYLAIASTERLIRGCSRVWPSYYRNAGTMEAIRWAPDDTLLRIDSFPEMTAQHCRLMEGWMTATMNALGAEVIDGRESACPSRGDAAHEFSCTWKKR